MCVCVCILQACSGSGCYDNLETLGLDAPPRVPPKKSRGSRDVAMETATSPVLLSPPSGWEGPLENLSMEDIQEVHLSVSLLRQGEINFCVQKLAKSTLKYIVVCVLACFSVLLKHINFCVRTCLFVCLFVGTCVYVCVSLHLQIVPPQPWKSEHLCHPLR